MRSRPLRVSFDVDATLTGIPDMPCEPLLPRWRRWLSPEPLRLGAVALMRELIRRDMEVWIYTTSFRTPRSLRGWLHAHGIVISGAINQTRHDQVVGRAGPSKLPLAFGIDLHVDDSEGVALEGQRHGFAVVQIRPEDVHWPGRVLAATAGIPRVVPATGSGGSA